MGKYESFSEWLIAMMFKAPAAMGVGLALEIAVTFFGTILFGDFAWWDAMHGSNNAFFISFAIFHVIGWIIVQMDWDYVSGVKRDIDPYYNTCYDGESNPNEFAFVQGEWIITGSVRHK